MNLEMVEKSGVEYALLSQEDRIKSVSDALDLIGNANYRGSKDIIIAEENLVSEFFDLKNGMAGEILQKFSTYGFRLAIVGSFEKYESKALQDFIRECNRGRQIFFIDNIDAAIEKFS